MLDDVAILTVRFRAPGGRERVASIGALHFNRLELSRLESDGKVPDDTSIENPGRTMEDVDAELRELAVPR